MEENNSASIQTGSLAPDFCLPSHQGGEVCLSDYRGKSQVIVFFVREFIWMQCRSLVAQLGRHNSDFQAADTQVLVILGDGPERAQKYAAELRLPFPVLPDPEREVYHRYGLNKAFVMIQRTAAIIIDREGKVRFIKAVTNPLSWLVEYEELYQETLRVSRQAVSN